MHSERPKAWTVYKRKLVARYPERELSLRVPAASDQRRAKA
jgi:hypothetical protein